MDENGANLDHGCGCTALEAATLLETHVQRYVWQVGHCCKCPATLAISKCSHFVASVCIQLVASMIASDDSSAVSMVVSRAICSALSDSNVDRKLHVKFMIRAAVLHSLRLEREAKHSRSPWSSRDVNASFTELMEVFAALEHDREVMRDGRLHKPIKQGIRAMLAILTTQDREDKDASITQEVIGDEVSIVHAKLSLLMPGSGSRYCACILLLQEICCPSGHLLKAFKTDSTTYTCDLCTEAQQIHCTMLGCRSCDHDMCVPCARRQTELKRAALAEAESAAEGAAAGEGDAPNQHTTSSASDTDVENGLALPSIQRVLSSPSKSRVQAHQLMSFEDRANYRRILDKVRSMNSVTAAAMKDFFEDTAAALTGGVNPDNHSQANEDDVIFDIELNDDDGSHATDAAFSEDNGGGDASLPHKQLDGTTAVNRRLLLVSCVMAV